MSLPFWIGFAARVRAVLFSAAIKRPAQCTGRKAGVTSLRSHKHLLKRDAGETGGVHKALITGPYSTLHIVRPRPAKVRGPGQ